MSTLLERARRAAMTQAIAEAERIRHIREEVFIAIADHFALDFHTPLPVDHPICWPDDVTVNRCSLVVDGLEFRVEVADPQNPHATITVYSDAPCPHCRQKDGGRAVRDLADLGRLLDARCRLCAATTTPFRSHPGADYTYVTDRGVFQALREDGDYPGLKVFVNDELAVVVEWNSLYETYVTRLYSPAQEEPIAQYDLDGRPLEV